MLPFGQLWYHFVMIEIQNALLRLCNRAFLHRGIPTYFVMRFLKNLLER
jgi:hypothetical protein